VTLIVSSVLFYMRVCYILEEGFDAPELKPNQLPLAYNSKSMPSVILTVFIEQMVALIFVVICCVIWVRCHGRRSWLTAKAEVGSYRDSMNSKVNCRESSLTLRVKEKAESKLCMGPCLLTLLFLPVSILAHMIVREAPSPAAMGDLPLKCEQCFTVVCSCDAPFLQVEDQHKHFDGGERLPGKDLEITFESVQGRCETAGTTSLELPATCTLSGSEEYECPDVDSDSWRHEWLTSQTGHLYQNLVYGTGGVAFQLGLFDTSWLHFQGSEIVFEGIEMTNAYEFVPAVIIFVILALVTFLYMERLQYDLRDAAVEIQDEVFGAKTAGYGFRCLPTSTVYSCCTCLENLCCCCLSGASLSQLLRIRLTLLLLYVTVVFLTQVAGTEQKSCFYRPLVFGSLDECSVSDRFLLIMARQCKGLIGSITLDDLLGQYFRSIVMHGIILPSIVIPETIALIADQIWNRNKTVSTQASQDEAIEKVHYEAVCVLKEQYSCSEDKAEEGWDQFLKPLVEAFDPFYLAKAPTSARQIVKIAMMQRLCQNFEKHLEETHSCPPDDAEQYASYLKEYLKYCANPEDMLRRLLEDVVQAGPAAYLRMEAKLRKMLPAEKPGPEESVVGMPVAVGGGERSQKLPCPQNCSTTGCPRDPWNRKAGEACCRACTATSGAKHGPNCEKRFFNKVNRVFSPSDRVQGERSSRSQLTTSSFPASDDGSQVSRPPTGTFRTEAEERTVSVDTGPGESAESVPVATEESMESLPSIEDDDPPPPSPLIGLQPRVKRKVTRPIRLDGDPWSGYTNENPQVHTCATGGCPRVPWNGQPGEYCCRTCARTGGKSHGAVCEASFTAEPWR